jgi:hypothetical protein
MGVFAAITFVFFSIAATKLPNYIGPVLPAVALLAAHAVVRRANRPEAPGRLWTVAAVLAGGALMLLAAVLFVAPFVIESLPEWIGDKAVKTPGLAEPIELGMWPYACGLLLVVTAAGGLVMHVRGRIVASVSLLAGGMAALLLLVVLFVVPRFDAHFVAPLRNMAREAARLAPPGKPVVLMGVKRKPSVIFHGGRPTRRVRRKSPEDIAALFRGPGPEVGITTAGYVDRLQGPGRLEILARDKGWILFRCSPAGE